MADTTAYKCTALTGGAAGALDAIDGALLLDGDFAFVMVGNLNYTYLLDVDSGSAESSPTIISPDVNAGIKRWVLQGSNVVVGSDADGDMYYRASSVLARLAKGAALALPRMNAGATAPEWGTAGQIAFPATAVPSADPNTLDDYEEGTFTFTMTPQTSGTITLNNATGRYTKIGRLVHIQGFLTITSVNSPVGIMALGGLPFASAVGTESWSSFLVSDNLVDKTRAYISASVSTITYSKYDDGALTIGTGWNAMLSGTYTI